jgi:hypothetical protein
MKLLALLVALFAVFAETVAARPILIIPVGLDVDARRTGAIVVVDALLRGLVLLADRVKI